MNISTVKTLYNVTRYNRIFNIWHKFAGNGSVSIENPSLKQNIHLTTPTVTSGNRYTISIENKFIITEFYNVSDNFVIRSRSFAGTGFCFTWYKESVVHFDAIWNWTDEYIWNNSILIHLYNIFFYQMIMMWKSGTGQNFFITANSL